MVSCWRRLCCWNGTFWKQRLLVVVENSKKTNCYNFANPGPIWTKLARIDDSPALNTSIWKYSFSNTAPPGDSRQNYIYSFWCCSNRDCCIHLKLSMWDPRPFLNMSVKGHLPTGSGTPETGSKVLHCPIDTKLDMWVTGPSLNMFTETPLTEQEVGHFKQEVPSNFAVHCPICTKPYMWHQGPVLSMSVKGHLPTGSGTPETGSKVLHCPIDTKLDMWVTGPSLNMFPETNRKLAILNRKCPLTLPYVVRFARNLICDTRDLSWACLQEMTSQQEVECPKQEVNS